MILSFFSQVFIHHLDFPFCERPVNSLVIVLLGCISCSCWCVGILEISLPEPGSALDCRAGGRGFRQIVDLENDSMGQKRKQEEKQWTGDFSSWSDHCHMKLGLSLTEAFGRAL